MLSTGPAASPEDEVARLTAAARAALARGGWWGFKVESVLRTAGLSTRCFYRHFETKDHLLLHLLEEDVSRASKRLERVCTDPDPLVRVRAWFDGVLDMAYVPRVAKPTVLFATHWRHLLGIFPDQVEACRAALTAPLVRALADLVASGAAGPGVDAEGDALGLFHIVSGPAADVISRGGSPDRATTEAQILPLVDRILGVTLPAASRHAWQLEDGRLEDG
ncbi:TetR/AcrR family transcriptional regulator [Frankia sp. Cas3]|uniref:TetR/AcrR family transcriptional regulator n=1 Tax=Frankia sp. Cas3 TaxID=3073926 RepID=UPI002AD3AFA2|nr:TetR family transcriptional regulator [Frankia sp. Cas3]